MEKLFIQYRDYDILENNYRESEYNYFGCYYLVYADSCCHLFVPDNLLSTIDEMRTGKYAVLTLGYDENMKKDCVEIMFEDFTDSPFGIQLALVLTSDSLFSASEISKKRLIIHGSTLYDHEMDLYIRDGTRPLPCRMPINAGFIEDIWAMFRNLQ